MIKAWIIGGQFTSRTFLKVLKGIWNFMKLILGEVVYVRVCLKQQSFFFLLYQSVFFSLVTIK